MGRVRLTPSQKNAPDPGATGVEGENQNTPCKEKI